MDAMRLLEVARECEQLRNPTMYPAERLRQIRELELYLFGGIPETPEPMQERDFHGRDIDRWPRSMDGHPNRQNNLPGEAVGFIEYDPRTGRIRFVEFTEGQGSR